MEVENKSDGGDGALDGGSVFLFLFLYIVP
jgi:hypothetical protein